MNYYYSPEYAKLLAQENKRVGYEWENLIKKPYSDEQVFNLIDKQHQRHEKLFSRFICG